MVKIKEMTKESTTVQSVDRALIIMDILQQNANGLGITELSSRMGLAKSTIHRMLTSLKNKGYVKQDPVTERYQLGLKLIELGSIVSQSLEIRSIAKPYMDQLVQETGETSHLVVLEDFEIIYIEKIESPYTIRMYSTIGKRAPLYCTGAGKAILSHLSEQEITKYLVEKELIKYTEKTIINKDLLLEELTNIKQKGYSVDDEEHELGIQCVAAPILDHNNNVVAGLSVAGPLMRMTEEKMNFCKEKVVYYAREISKTIGYRA